MIILVELLLVLIEKVYDCLVLKRLGVVNSL